MRLATVHDLLFKHRNLLSASVYLYRWKNGSFIHQFFMFCVMGQEASLTRISNVIGGEIP